MKANKLGFEKKYLDDSGVEFGIYLDNETITIEAIDAIDIPAEHVDWLIGCLNRIKAEIETKAAS